MPDTTEPTPYETLTRSNILQRLKRRTVREAPERLNYGVIESKQWEPRERARRVQELLTAVHAEVLECTERSFGKVFRGVVADHGIQRLLVGSGSKLEAKLGSLKKRTPQMIPELVPYAEPLEQSKDLLFGIEAGITSVRSGIAETGTLVVWPTPQEPRLLSLVPPLHLAVLYASTIHNTFLEAMTRECWSQAMPTNALLISGPSKTADIEQMLVYGVHGPKQLVLFLIDDLRTKT